MSRTVRVPSSVPRLAKRGLRALGLRSFRPHQYRLVSALLRGRSVVGVLGTGRGKSVCWQVPAVVRPGVTVVVSPHVSLAVDQVARFNASIQDRSGLLGRRAAYLNSLLTRPERRAVLADVQAGGVCLLYVTPEGLGNHNLQAALKAVGVSLLVVDEAHCVVDHSSFRPHYLRLGAYARALGAPQIACFSATLPKGFVTDTVQAVLGLRHPVVVRGPLNRPHHYYDVVGFSGPGAAGARLAWLHNRLHDLWERGYGRGILYCARKADVPRLIEHLRAWGYPAVSYVGGLESAADRQQNQANQAAFAAGEIPILVATRAFELGIDVPDVRWVIALNPPATLSNLFQQWGRAGRDDKPAYCAVLHTPQDAHIQRAFQDSNHLALDALGKGLPGGRVAWKQHQAREAERLRRFLHDPGCCKRTALLAAHNRKPVPAKPSCCCACSSNTRR